MTLEGRGTIFLYFQIVDGLIAPLPNRLLSSMAHIEDPDDLLSLLNAEYDPVKFEEDLAECSL